MADDEAKYTLYVVGPGAVGKTSLTIRFLSDHFSDEYEPTIEDFYRKTIEVDNVQSVLEIYDTAGQEEFSTMQDSYYRSGHGFILVYNITSALSFNDLQDTYNKLVTARNAENDNVNDHDKPPIVLAGNKCDLSNLRQVPYDNGKKLAKQWNCPFFETSAKDRINIETIFEELVREIERRPPVMNNESETLTIKQKDSGCSCIVL
eukprot:355241_1